MLPPCTLGNRSGRAGSGRTCAAGRCRGAGLHRSGRRCGGGGASRLLPRFRCLRRLLWQCCCLRLLQGSAAAAGQPEPGCPAAQAALLALPPAQRAQRGRAPLLQTAAGSRAGTPRFAHILPASEVHKTGCSCRSYQLLTLHASKRVMLHSTQAVHPRFRLTRLSMPRRQRCSRSSGHQWQSHTRSGGMDCSSCGRLPMPCRNTRQSR